MKAIQVFVTVVVYASMAKAQTPGTFLATGKMITPRYSHTATLLADGRVLIAGGDSAYTANATEATAELYDPAAGTFAATGSMAKPRYGHAATLLPNGKVLIAGGWPIYGGTSSAPSAELYDPATGTFAATGAMIVERAYHTATLLNSGKVLIAGGSRLVVSGSVSTLSIPASAELYDPVTGTFTATGDMNEPGCDTATLLANGKVLITRGIIYNPATDLETFVTHAELYDPSTGTFTFTGDMTSFHSRPTATLLLNGKVLIAGGDIGDGDGASDRAELYDPATGTFTGTRKLTTGREQDAATLLPDGTVLFTGGHGNYFANPDNLASAEIYDPATGAFRTAGTMITGRDILGATLLGNGRVLVTGGNQYYPFSAGGRDPQHPEVAIAELYTPTVLMPPPVLLAVSGDGSRQGAILHASSHRLVSAGDPAVAGEALEVYLTGLADGGVIPPQLAIGGRAADVLWFGNTPGYQGLNQINVRVPDGVAPGSAAVRLTYLDRPSNEVTMGVK
jgi:hypothetical protein